MASPAEDVIWSSTKGVQEHYLELLESGTLSDTQVRCGKRTWKVHKAILCVRSEWFKKALTGRFKEAKEGSVNIKEFKENEVDCLLRYIYTGSINVSKNFTAPVGLYASMSIWKIGDFFRLSDLCQLALDETDATFRRVSWTLAAKNSAESAKESATGNIVKLVRVLYNQGRNDVRDAFKPTILAFLVSGIHILEKNKTFKDLLYEIPVFASDWAVTLTDNMPSINAPESAEKCTKCMRSMSYRPRAVSFKCVRWVKEQKVEGFCNTCYPLRQLEDWIGGDR